MNHIPLPADFWILPATADFGINDWENPNWSQSSTPAPFGSETPWFSPEFTASPASTVSTALTPPETAELPSQTLPRFQERCSDTNLVSMTPLLDLLGSSYPSYLPCDLQTNHFQSIGSSPTNPKLDLLQPFWTLGVPSTISTTRSIPVKDGNKRKEMHALFEKAFIFLCPTEHIQPPLAANILGAWVSRTKFADADLVRLRLRPGSKRDVGVHWVKRNKAKWDKGKEMTLCDYFPSFLLQRVKERIAKDQLSRKKL
ncbi:hypothetical protein T439DRAFT_357514 [Meredithblackwellia eburnea MCA 4105]